jgi:hypothetical protein
MFKKSNTRNFILIKKAELIFYRKRTKINSTCEAITSIKFKTAISAVTSFGAIVFMIEGAGEPVNDV